MNLTRKTTIEDVAELAGVSIKTVSRVTNREPNVRQSTREKVEEAITKLNYRPNIAARNLASQSSHFIVLVYDDPSAYENPSAGYIIRMQQGALNACRTANSELLIHPCDYRSAGINRELRSVIERSQPHGIILAAPLSNMPQIVDAIGSTGTPFVRLSPGMRNGDRYAVATNDREISAEMTCHLASLNHERIAFITGDPNHKAVVNRFHGYEDGLRQSGLEFSERLVVDGDLSIASGEACAAELLARRQRPTAIFAANDDMAAGVFRAADRMNIDIPGQLSVAGCDDSSLARQLYPTLTTIRQPLARMAERATLALLGDAEDESFQGLEIVAGSLQIRESTGPAPE